MFVFLPDEGGNWYLSHITVVHLAVEMVGLNHCLNLNIIACLSVSTHILSACLVCLKYFFLYFPKVLSKILTGSSYLDRLMKHWNKGLRLSGPWCSKDLTTILKDLIWGRSTSIIKFDKR